MKNWLIKKLGGFTAKEHISLTNLFTEIKEENNKLRYRLKDLNERDVLTEAVKELFNTIGPDDILREVNGQWMVGDKVIEEGSKRQLINEAQVISQMKLWDYLQKDIQYGANRTMYLKARTNDHLVAGKLWLWMLDSLRSRIKSVSEGNGKQKITDLS